ncbi:MAG: enoyl-CoA hydratase, partial [Alphaproteobacteria bacterium]|nr:enoyl-CoA hydratase [Alphaproteobacteria bacterium]
MSAKPQPAEPVLLQHLAGGVLTLTLNRPRQRNSLSRELMSALQEALDAAAGNPEVRCIVVAGAGPGFCSGHDLKEIRAFPERATHEAVLAQCGKMMQTIVRHPKPVIAR